MVWAVAIILGLLWAFGMASSFTQGGYLHVLIAVAITLVAYGFYRRHREKHAH